MKMQRKCHETKSKSHKVMTTFKAATTTTTTATPEADNKPVVLEWSKKSENCVCNRSKTAIYLYSNSQFKLQHGFKLLSKILVLFQQFIKPHQQIAAAGQKD